MHIRSCDLLLPFAPEPLVYPVPESLCVCCPSLFIGGYLFCSRVRQYVQYKRIDAGRKGTLSESAAKIPPDRDAMHFNGGIEAEAEEEGGGRREHLKDSFALFFSFRLPPSISTSLYYAIPVLP